MMMNIDRNNYESYFLDYLEGNLDEKFVDDFIEFLQQNPDLKMELSNFDPISLEPEKIKFREKKKLFKVKFDSDSLFEKTALENLEGDISEEEKKSFENYLHLHPEKSKEFKIFKKTKLLPDESVRYKGKSKLYHRSVGKTTLLWSVRIAAILVLALLVYLLSDQSHKNTTIENRVASVDEQIMNKESSPETGEFSQLPLKEEKKEVSTEEKKTKQSVQENLSIKKLEIKPAKSLRENIKNRLDEDGISLKRIPVEAFPEMNPVLASLDFKQTNLSLAEMNRNIEFNEPPVREEKLLFDVVKEKTGLNNFSFNKIKKTGLNLVAGFTKDNFSYETNEEGQITEINYDSRLMAFTIPTRSNNDEK